MKRIVFILFLFQLATMSRGQGIFFQKIIGNAGSFYSRDVIQVADTGYVICGSSSGLGDFTANGFLMKLDKMGNRLWTKSYGGPGADWSMRVLEETDGSLVFTGYTNSSGAGGYDIWVVKTDENGIEQWSRTYGGQDWDFGYSISKTNDGNYLIAGETYTYGNGNADGFLLKIDVNGDSLWMKTYGGSENDKARKAIVLGDGTIVFTGTTSSAPSVSKDIWMVKTDEDGNILWERRHGTERDDEGTSIVASRFNNELVGSAITDSLPGSKKIDQLFFRTDANGNLLCGNLYGGPENETANDVCERWNGIGIIAGQSLSYGAGFGDMITYYVDMGCYWTGGQTVGTVDMDEAWAVKETSDSGYVMVGQTENGPGFTNVYIVKAGPTLFITPLLITEFDISSVDDPESGTNFSYYPNPLPEGSDLHYNWPQHEGKNRVKIFDLSSKLVLEKDVFGSEGNISFPQLESGVYFLEIIHESSGDRVVRRLIKGVR